MAHSFLPHFSVWDWVLHPIITWQKWRWYRNWKPAQKRQQIDRERDNISIFMRQNQINMWDLDRRV